MKKHLVFVYGTLRQGEGNHFLLKHAKLIHLNAWTHGKLYDTGYGYPCMVRNDQGRVKGELYAVSDYELLKLDHLEGYRGPGKNNDYDRVQQTVYTLNQEYRAQLYVYSNMKARRLREIENGDWKKRP